MARKDVQACEIGYPALKNEQNRCLMLKYKHKYLCKEKRWEPKGFL